MPSKNDLSGLKIQPRNTLRNLQTPTETKQGSTAGRKPKPVTEKQSEIVGLRFTKSEYETLKKQAGLVPVATYLRHALMTQTDVFKN